MLQFYFLISDLSDSGAARVGGVKAWQLTFTMLREKTAHAEENNVVTVYNMYFIYLSCHRLNSSG